MWASLCARGPEHGGFSTQSAWIVEQAVQLHSKIAQNRVQLLSARNGREHGQLATALGEHRAQALARLEDPLDENYVFVSHAETPGHERGVEEFG